MITVRFIYCGGFVGKSILWTTNSLWSHVEFGTDKGWLGAHAGSGIQERLPDYCRPQREAVYALPCTPDEETELLTWARSFIGTKYNYATIAGILFRNRHWTSPGRFICSQFVVDGLLQVFGARRVLNVLSDDKYTALITPETLHLSPIFVGHLLRKTA